MNDFESHCKQECEGWSSGSGGRSVLGTSGRSCPLSSSCHARLQSCSARNIFGDVDHVASHI